MMKIKKQNHLLRVLIALAVMTPLFLQAQSVYKGRVVSGWFASKNYSPV